MSKSRTQDIRSLGQKNQGKTQSKPGRQLSLLDLETREGPTERERLTWHAFHTKPFAEQVDRFREAYGEEPVFWKRLSRKQVDLFMTHPKNVLLISLETGELLQDGRLRRSAWARDISQYTLERRKHISSQVASLLDGKMGSEDWSPEVMHFFRFKEDRSQELLRYLSEIGLESCLEKDGFKRLIRVFGAPEKLKAFFKRGLELGFLQDVSSG